MFVIWFVVITAVLLILFFMAKCRKTSKKIKELEDKLDISNTTIENNHDGNEYTNYLNKN